MVACGLCVAEWRWIFYPWYFDDTRIGLAADAHGEDCSSCGGYAVVAQCHCLGIPMGLGGVAVAMAFGKNRGSAGVYRPGRDGIAGGAQQAGTCVGMVSGVVGVCLYHYSGSE